MGYYTSYNLKVTPRVEPCDSDLIEIAKMIDIIFDDVIFGDLELMYIKEHNIIDVFFERKEDGISYILARVSEMFPEYTFYLEGRGEFFPADWWVQYYKNGERSKKIFSVIKSPDDIANGILEEKFLKND